MTRHIYSDYVITDPETLRRHQNALKTWRSQTWEEFPITTSENTRTWEENSKTLPFLKDIFDYSCRGLRNDDIIIYTNHDIMVSPDCLNRVEKALEQVSACYAFRRDFTEELKQSISTELIQQGKEYDGSDLAAFRVEWWLHNQHLMPDMILGLEAWDPCFRTLADETNPDRDCNIPNIIAHELHSPFWRDVNNRYNFKGQLHNLELAKKFFRDRGIDPSVYEIQ